MSFSTATLKRDTLQLDYSRLLDDASAAPHLMHIVDVEIDPECNWLRVWDLALDRGPAGTSCAMAMLKLAFSPSGNCPFGSCEHVLGNDHLGGHFRSVHTTLTGTLNDCKLALKDLSGEMFSRHCMNCFHVVIMCNCPVYQLVHSITAYYPVSNSYPHTNFLEIRAQLHHDDL